ncbi:peptidoglycan D,D-transpeptidase FtsI family protein [Rubrivivax albus]|uniref:Peptidoglycan D,D-transpeptidase FtsI n=1 Tax=Rubrivivax albus TaxID=2499835 RepID=A0A437JZY3_9BURK|nr:penicillin-binding protein 2 [Rubrivivax albus]RVT53584.1 penicillin-binding protein 2 [Rubrivivax albus]
MSLRSVNYASSPLLASKTPPWRSRFIVACVALAFVVLAGRAVWVQVLHSDFYQREGEKRFLHAEDVPAGRGNVLDRNGRILAASVPAIDIAVRPPELQATPEQKRALARLAGMTPKALEARLNSHPRFVWLKRGVDAGARAELQALLQQGVVGVELSDSWRRAYPEGEAAAQVVGFTDLEQNGLEGIERVFQDALRGSDGQRTVVRDRLGRVVEHIGEPDAPEPGRDVVLSIDARLQALAYQRLRDAVKAHGANSGSLVALDAQTGEVLALTNYPSYDPDDRRNLKPAQLRNRALTDIFEPGSTMKPFAIALALDKGIARPTTRYETAPGWITITGSTIRDSHPHGVLSVAEIVQKSSNVGTVKMAMQLQPREMWQQFTDLGLGSKPEIEFPGAATGRVRPYKTWRPIEQATMSYGYGLSASLLQMARAYTVFARDGEIAPVTLLKRDAGPVPGRRVMSAETARAMRDMLRLAAGPGGTAPKAQTVGYSVGGKTGTARKQEGRGYSTEKYRSWFVGLAPVSAPKLVVAVMIDEPRKGGVFYGGEVAAPVFSSVVQQSLRTLGVAPDIDFQPGIVAEPGPAALEST